jgi:hypothetical protein
MIAKMVLLYYVNYPGEKVEQQWWIHDLFTTTAGWLLLLVMNQPARQIIEHDGGNDF